MSADIDTRINRVNFEIRFLKKRVEKLEELIKDNQESLENGKDTSRELKRD